MAVKTKYYYGAPGSTGFYDPDLSNTTILNVTRSGLTYNVIIAGEAANLEALHLQSSGGIFFDPNNPFSGDPLSLAFFDFERISVKFRA